MALSQVGESGKKGSIGGIAWQGPGLSPESSAPWLPSGKKADLALISLCSGQSWLTAPQPCGALNREPRGGPVSPRWNCSVCAAPSSVPGDLSYSSRRLTSAIFLPSSHKYSQGTGQCNGTYARRGAARPAVRKAPYRPQRSPYHGAFINE